MKRHRQHCKWSRQQHVLLYVIKWQMIRFQALWKTKSFVKVCLKFKLPLWTKGLLIHLSPLWQLPLWHFPRWHNFPVKLKLIAAQQPTHIVWSHHIFTLIKSHNIMKVYIIKWQFIKTKPKIKLTDWQVQVSWTIPIFRMMLIDPSSFRLDEHQL